MRLLTDGAFGRTVGKILAARTGATVLELSAALEDLSVSVGDAVFVAVASWRDGAADLDAVDAACFTAGIPWCASRLAAGRLVTGPLVVPGYGPCFECYRRRTLCHAQAPERDLVLQHAYAGDRDLGVPGFVLPIAAMAAGALEALSRLGPAQAGRVISADFFAPDLVDTRVVAVHGCQRCGRADGAPGSRFTEHLIPALEQLLP